MCGEAGGTESQFQLRDWETRLRPTLLPHAPSCQAPRGAVQLAAYLSFHSPRQACWGGRRHLRGA